MAVRNEQGVHVTHSFRRRMCALAGALFVGMAVLASATPASGQPFTGGTGANALTGSGIVVNCPPGSPGAVNGGAATVGVATVANTGVRCTPTAADASGLYGIGAPATLRFQSSCDANTGQTGGFVDVPAGSTVNGVFFAGPTTVTALNATVVYPNGTTATVNQVIVGATSVTRNAVAINGGPIIGQVVCGGAAVYPLAVDVSAAGEAVSNVAKSLPAGGGGGSGSTMLLLASGVALALIGAQVAVAKKWRRAGEAG